MILDAFLRSSVVALMTGVLLCPSVVAAQGQSGAPRHHRTKQIPSQERLAVVAPGTVRGLTVTRRPQGYGSDFGTEDDIYQDGPTRYNSVRTFDPAPYVDSGRQFPFGLDGIGGYGSDLGFAAGFNSAIYDRGP